MSAALTATMTLGDLKVVVRELTVPEIRAELAKTDLPPADLDLLDVELVEGFPLWDLPIYCDLTREKITAHKLAPSQIGAVVAKIRELNRDFFAMCARAEQRAARQATGSPSLSEKSPS